MEEMRRCVHCASLLSFLGVRGMGEGWEGVMERGASTFSPLSLNVCLWIMILQIFPSPLDLKKVDHFDIRIIYLL
jgi:hypothetical protein